MKFISKRKTWLGGLLAALLVVGGIGMAVAASSAKTPSNSVRAGRGIDEFGMTRAFFKGHSTSFTYTTGSAATRTSRRPRRAGARVARSTPRPEQQHDPLYITVPLGFTVPMNIGCPNALICVDHPGTIDLTRLEPALKPLYPDLTDEQLRAALNNFAVPGHEHFITDRTSGKAEWWDVQIVGVTNRAEYQKLNQHKSAAYLLKQVKAGKTTPVIPTNLFLFFGVK